MIELENRTRNVYHFTVVQIVQVGKAARTTVDRSKTVIVGDANDATLPPGTERGIRCPSPIARVSQEIWDSKGFAASRRTIDALVAKGELVLRQVAA
jgi:hypothetical protein